MHNLIIIFLLKNRNCHVSDGWEENHDLDGRILSSFRIMFGLLPVKTLITLAMDWLWICKKI